VALIGCQTGAKKLTAEQVAEALLKQEMKWSHEACGRKYLAGADAF
jgi:hypothetical protein